VVGLIDGLGLGEVNLVEASMGGFIAQAVALEHADRVRTLTLIMTSTGSRRVGRPKPRVYVRLLRQRVSTGRPAAMSAAVETSRLIGSHGFAFDEQYVRDLAGRSWDCSATLTVSVSGLIGVIEGERAGFARVLVAGCAARRHRERVGFGAALPVIFWRGLGEGRVRVQRSTGAHGRQRRRARRADAGRGRFVLP